MDSGKLRVEGCIPLRRRDAERVGRVAGLALRSWRRWIARLQNLRSIRESMSFAARLRCCPNKKPFRTIFSLFAHPPSPSLRLRVSVGDRSPPTRPPNEKNRSEPYSHFVPPSHLRRPPRQNGRTVPNHILISIVRATVRAFWPTPHIAKIKAVYGRILL